MQKGMIKIDTEVIVPNKQFKNKAELIFRELSEMDINKITPLEALQKLSELKEKQQK